MEIWLAAFHNVFSPMPLLFIFGGVMMGVMLGAIPGLNSTMGTALLIPFTYAMDATTGLLLLTAVYCGGTFGGSISAILFNVPGSPEASVTGFDGYPDGQGRPGRQGARYRHHVQHHRRPVQCRGHEPDLSAARQGGVDLLRSGIFRSRLCRPDPDRHAGWEADDQVISDRLRRSAYRYRRY